MFRLCANTGTPIECKIGFGLVSTIVARVTVFNQNGPNSRLEKLGLSVLECGTVRRAASQQNKDAWRQYVTMPSKGSRLKHRFHF
jgi:hypothetical protein